MEGAPPEIAQIINLNRLNRFSLKQCSVVCFSCRLLLAVINSLADAGLTKIGVTWCAIRSIQQDVHSGSVLLLVALKKENFTYYENYIAD